MLGAGGRDKGDSGPGVSSQKWVGCWSRGEDGNMGAVSPPLLSSASASVLPWCLFLSASFRLLQVQLQDPLTPTPLSLGSWERPETPQHLPDFFCSIATSWAPRPPSRTPAPAQSCSLSLEKWGWGAVPPTSTSSSPHPHLPCPESSQQPGSWVPSVHLREMGKPLPITPPCWIRNSPQGV